MLQLLFSKSVGTDDMVAEQGLVVGAQGFISHIEPLLHEGVVFLDGLSQRALEELKRI